MFEALRKLTANYTPEEYEKWLYEDYLADIPKGKNDYTVPEIKGNERIKDIACLLTEIAEATGYAAEFLYKQFEEAVTDRRELGETFIDARRLAFNDVACISYEKDW